MVVLKDAIDSLMYEVDRVSIMVARKRALIPIVKCLANQKSGRKVKGDDKNEELG